MLKSGFRAIIIGAPGSGKGTISTRIVKHFDIHHVSSGDVLRNHILVNSDLGIQAKQFVNKGQLVPDEVMISLILNELSPVKTNWILDGFPRTRMQTEKLFSKVNVDAAINVVVPFDVIIDRIKGRWIHEPSGRIYNTEFNPPRVMGKDDETGDDLIQRPDDNPEAVKKRLDIYSNTVNPILEYCNEKKILQNFYGRTTAEIWPQVYKFLSAKIKPIKEI